MREAWLLLGLATELQLLFTFGFKFKNPWSATLLLLPLLAGLASRKLPVLRQGWPLKVAALLSFHAALFLARRQVLLPFDATNLFSGLTVAVTLVGAVWVLRSLPAAGPGPFDRLWLGVWLAMGWVDPILPLLGLGLMTLLMAFGRWPASTDTQPKAGFAAWLVLGLVISKPWWDFGLERTPAWALACFVLGWHLAQKAPLGRRLGRVGTLTALGCLGILYAPTILWAWGLLAGLAWGWRQKLETAEGTPGNLAPAAGGLTLGIGLSFALHANAWLPGLRHLIWLGN